MRVISITFGFVIYLASILLVLSKDIEAGKRNFLENVQTLRNDADFLRGLNFVKSSLSHAAPKSLEAFFKDYLNGYPLIESITIINTHTLEIENHASKADDSQLSSFQITLNESGFRDSEKRVYLSRPIDETYSLVFTLDRTHIANGYPFITNIQLEPKCEYQIDYSMLIKSNILFLVISFLLAMFIAIFAHSILNLWASYIKSIGDMSRGEINAASYRGIIFNDFYKKINAAIEMFELERRKRTRFECEKFKEIEKNKAMVEIANEISHDGRTYIELVEKAIYTIQRDLKGFKPDLLHSISVHQRYYQDLLESLCNLNTPYIIEKNVPLDLNAIVSSVLDDLKCLSQVPINFKITILHTKVPLGEALGIERVIRNILKNCHEHTPYQGDIFVKTMDCSTGVEVLIGNTGSSIDPSVIADIFSRKFSTKEGGGLGLFIVKKILDAHSITIKPESYEKITSFTFTLSCRDDQNETAFTPNIPVCNGTCYGKR